METLKIKTKIFCSRCGELAYSYLYDPYGEWHAWCSTIEIALVGNEDLDLHGTVNSFWQPYICINGIYRHESRSQFALILEFI